MAWDDYAGLAASVMPEFTMDQGSGAEAWTSGAPLGTGRTSGVYEAPDVPLSPTGLSDFASRVLSRAGEFAGKVGSSIGRSFEQSPLQALAATLGLGATSFGIANQANVQGQLGRQTRAIERGQRLAESAAAPAVAFGREQLERARAGKISEPLEASIEQWKQGAKTRMAARLASMGLGDSTTLEQMTSLIDQQAVAMKATMLAQQEETGLGALQTGVSAGTGVTGSAANQQAALAQLIQQANQQLAAMTAQR